MFCIKRAGTVQNYADSLPMPMTEVVGGVTYIGYCEALGTKFDAPKWMIIRVTDAGGLVTPEYALGNARFEHKWSDRASLQYSR